MLLVQSVSHPLYPFDQCRHIEVDQQADWPPTKSQVGMQLFAMDRQERFNRLHFNDDSVGYQEIKTIALVQSYAFILDGEVQLSLEWHLAQRELATQTLLVC